jgi:hypothetical protein
MIYERRSRLSGKQQRRLIDLFVAGSDCASRGRACRCEPKHRTNVLPSTPSAHRQQAPSYDLSGEVEADESSFGGVARATVAEQRQARCPYGACSNEAGRCLPPLCRMPGRERCCRSFASRCHRTASSIQIVSRRRLCWMSRRFITGASTLARPS